MVHIHSDHLNTPQAVTDENQQIVWRADYRPFGEVTETVSTIHMSLRYPGQVADDETGLSYNYFRSYDPATGRYTQTDPLGVNGGLNLFLYAVANPLRYADPNGLEAVATMAQHGWGITPTPPPNVEVCNYYSAKYSATGCRYYMFGTLICKTANANPLFTRDASATPGNLDCVRKCLVREDKKAWKNKKNYSCEDGKCLSDEVIDNYHLKCFAECGVNPDIYPGVGVLN